MKAYHFLADSGKLRDGRASPPDGVWLVHEGDIEMCQSGLHASRRPLDALHYAPGSLLCRVEDRKDITEEKDKLVCRERRIIWRQDATDMLRAFARQCAADVAHLWDPPEVVLQYLRTGDETLRAAAWDAARAAARAAAEDAARAAAWDATEDAGWDAAWAATWDAARDAARDAQNKKLEAYIRDMRRGVTYWEIDV